jgi:hypothetical protein
MQLSGVRRLRGAIVLGYQLRRVPGDVGVPDWYSLSEKEIGVRAKTPTDDTGETILCRVVSSLHSSYQHVLLLCKLPLYLDN